MNSANWSKSGETLSDKSARKEFGLTQKEIIDGINDGRLQFRAHNIYGNPWFRLLRSEVVSLVSEIRGNRYLKIKQVQNELAEADTVLRMAKAQVASLSARRNELLAILEDLDSHLDSH